MYAQLNATFMCMLFSLPGSNLQCRVVVRSFLTSLPGLDLAGLLSRAPPTTYCSDRTIAEPRTFQW